MGVVLWFSPLQPDIRLLAGKQLGNRPASRANVSVLFCFVFCFVFGHERVFNNIFIFWGRGEGVFTIAHGRRRNYTPTPANQPSGAHPPRTPRPRRRPLAA